MDMPAPTHTPDDLEAQFADLRRLVDNWQRTIDRMNQVMAVLALIAVVAVGGFIATAGGMFR